VNDELNPDARQLVDLAREARTPGDQDKLRIAERLAIPLAAGVIAGSAAGAAKAAAGATTGAKLAGVGATQAANTTLLGSIGAKIAAAVAVAAVGTALVVSNLDSQPAETPLASAPAAVPSPVVAPSQPAPAAETSPPAPEPVIEAPKAAPANPPTIHSTTPAHELAQEAALLHEAQSAWRSGQSAQALQLANQHAQRFPHSQLADERDVLRVLSLCKLGQVQSAKQIGTRLLRKTKAPWYQSVADSCAAD
jgi:hypothetical protein